MLRLPTKIKKNKLIAIVVAGFLLLGIFVAVGISQNWWQKASNETAQDNIPETPQTKIDLSPPTEQDKQANDKRKEELGKPADTSSSGADPKTVTPIVTYARQVEATIEVNAFVQGVVESGGTCTFNFTKDNVEVTETTTATPDATTTRCGKFFGDKHKFFANGTWKVRVVYKSPTAKGESSTTTFEVK